ncbi:purine-nucleoside phosphorylase [Vallitalea guaymasensis]|uniref:Uridine phosphorylase n=1 Tax=Vallitalea guaymasensis TaxID=1185412 RepID=A0A8J8SAV3_9FIRM|nr:purine-nucleoside phosphorylase [Vallitalea guaymasensis]QUH27686.1 purine-nucleoside phosphorylase [Vallitalea guaymasensis]
MSIPTPHIECKDKNLISKTVLMPGDPLRAKFIADTYLTDVVKFNNVRNMFGYTGNYKGKRISVMGSGMGMPSIGIYSYELFNFYDVENIIRIGSCGSYTEDLKLYDVILVDEAWSKSSYAKVQNGYDKDVIEASKELNEEIAKHAEELNIPIVRGRIHSSDVFYSSDLEVYKSYRDDYGCLAAEMESFALFANAKVSGKNAACILTVSDSIATKEETSSEERQNAFTRMMEIALQFAE